MKGAIKLFTALSTLALVRAEQLDHLALTDDLDYLIEGNSENLPSIKATITQWPSRSIPEDCKNTAENEDFSPSDIDVYEVKYKDCDDPWLFCHHKDVEVDIKTAAETFSQVPVRMRDWVRQVMFFPGANSAFSSNGNLAFFGTTGKNVDVMIHETGHCLDGFDACGEGLSSSQGFLDAYNNDTHVPDNYARTSQVENVAQNIVVAVYDSNVPGGFPGVQNNSQAIAHQYKYIEKVCGNILKPGGTCNRQLEDSDTVHIATSSSSSSTSITTTATMPSSSSSSSSTMDPVTVTSSSTESTPSPSASNEPSQTPLSTGDNGENSASSISGLHLSHRFLYMTVVVGVLFF